MIDRYLSIYILLIPFFVQFLKFLEEFVSLKGEYSMHVRKRNFVASVNACQILNLIFIWYVCSTFLVVSHGVENDKENEGGKKEKKGKKRKKWHESCWIVEREMALHMDRSPVASEVCYRWRGYAEIFPYFRERTRMSHRVSQSINIGGESGTASFARVNFRLNFVCFTNFRANTKISLSTLII